MRLPLPFQFEWQKHAVAWLGWVALSFLLIRFQCLFPITFAPNWILAGAFALPTLAYWCLGRWGMIAVVVGALFARGDGTMTWEETLAGTACMFIGRIFAFFSPWIREALERPILQPRDVLFHIASHTVLAISRGLAALVVGFIVTPDAAWQAGVGSVALTSFALVFALPIVATSRISGWPKWSGWAKAIEGAAGFIGMVFATAFLMKDGGPISQNLPLPFVSIIMVFGTWVAIRFDLFGASLLALTALFVTLFFGIYTGKHPFFPADLPWQTQVYYLFLVTGVVFAYLLMASSAKASKNRDHQQQVTNLQLQMQAKRLADLNERFQIQSLKLADQAEELLNQRDQLELSNQNLESQQAWLDAVFMHMPVGVYVIDAKEKQMKRSHREMQIPGFDNLLPIDLPQLHARSMEVTKPDGSLLPYEDWPIIRAVRTGEIVNAASIRVKTSTGEVSLIMNAAPIRNNANEIIGAVAVTLDTTERERVNRAVAESEERLRFAMKAAGMMAWDSLQGSNQTIRSESMRSWLKLPEAEHDLASEEVIQFILPEDRERVRASFAEINKSGQTRVEYRLRRADGELLMIESTGQALLDSDGNVKRLAGVHRDITNEYQTRERLLLLESAVVHAHDAVIILSGNPSHSMGRLVLYVNDAFTRITGYTREEVLGRSLYGLRGPETNTNTLDSLRQSLDNGLPFRAELLNYRKDGTPVWVDLAVEPVTNGETIIHWVMIQRDISDRKKTEAALSESEAKFRGIFENAWAGVSITDSQGRFVECNPAYAELLARPIEEILGKTAEEFTVPEDWAAQETLRQDLFLGRVDRYQMRKRYNRPQGEFIWTELWITAIRNSDGVLLYSLGVSVDVTERLRLEDQLRQSQKMEAFGQLAGGIAHDFNNLLTAILGNLSLVRLPVGDANRNLIKVAEQAGARAADLTRKLLGYARRTHMMPVPVRVGDVIEEVIGILKRTIDPRIVILSDIRPCPNVLADATLLNQVLFNLCLNSRDAMPEGGTLEISTNSLVVDLLNIGYFPEANLGIYTQLTVTDTGEGISQENRKRIFEPFFTTKGVGQGTGLGLSMVQGIIQQHGGWISCESKQAEGTRFDLYLPATLTELNTTSPRVFSQVDSRTPVSITSQNRVTPNVTSYLWGGTILLVDDEPMIRTLARAVLESDGFTVYEAEDGVEAIESYVANDGQFDLIILDLTMPRMSGRDTFRKLQGINPQVLVLFSSGYSAEDISDVSGSAGMLSKPYRPDSLLEAVQRVLNRDAVGV